MWIEIITEQWAATLNFDLITSFSEEEGLVMLRTLNEQNIFIHHESQEYIHALYVAIGGGISGYNTIPGEARNEYDITVKCHKKKTI